MKDTSTKTDFYYKEVDLRKYNSDKEMNQLIKECRNTVNLDFFSVDFAEDSKGKLHLIEMNSRTGMGVDKMVKLYELIYEDFYGKKVDSSYSKELKDLTDKWEVAYREEKGSLINECTVIAGKLDGVSFLFKNRDRSYTPDSIVKREKISGVEVVYYTDQTGWVEGMNEHGVGFVFTQLTNKSYKGYELSYTVTDDPKDDSKFKPFEASVKKALTAKTANQAVDLMIKSKKSGSFLIGDPKEIYELEVFENEHRSRKLDTDMYVKTNHGTLFPEAGHQPDGESIKRASTAIRKHQAETQLLGVKTLNEIPARMKFQAFDSKSPLNTFRTDDEEYTISQCMMALTNLEFYFYHDRMTADTIKLEDTIKDPKIKIKIFVV